MDEVRVAFNIAGRAASASSGEIAISGGLGRWTRVARVWYGPGGVVLPSHPDPSQIEAAALAAEYPNYWRAVRFGPDTLVYVPRGYWEVSWQTLSEDGAIVHSARQDMFCDRSCRLWYVTVRPDHGLAHDPTALAATFSRRSSEDWDDCSGCFQWPCASRVVSAEVVAEEAPKGAPESEDAKR